MFYSLSPPTFIPSFFPSNLMSLWTVLLLLVWVFCYNAALKYHMLFGIVKPVGFVCLFACLFCSVNKEMLSCFCSLCLFSERKLLKQRSEKKQRSHVILFQYSIFDFLIQVHQLIIVISSSYNLCFCFDPYIFYLLQCIFLPSFKLPLRCIFNTLTIFLIYIYI